MFSFSKLCRCAALACAALAASPADAQDLSVQFHAPADQFVQRAQLPARPDRAFTPDDPARILVIGDSLAQGLGIFLDRRVEERQLIAQVTNKGRTSTGLSRSDFYDWPAEFAVQAAEVRPDVVVVHFGSNDKQAVVRNGRQVRLGSDDWDAAYRAQTRRILDIAAQTGAVVYWLGPAPDKSNSINSHLTRINPIFEDEARLVHAHYVPLSSFAAGRAGEFVRSVPVDGRVVQIRSGDGSHFTEAGYYLVADRLLADMERRMPTMFTDPGWVLAGILQ